MTLFLVETWTQAALVIREATEKASIPSHAVCSRSSLNYAFSFVFSFYFILFFFWRPSVLCTTSDYGSAERGGK